MNRPRALLATFLLIFALALTFVAPASASSATGSPDKPTWWEKYQYLAKNGPMACKAANVSLSVGANVDVYVEAWRLCIFGIVTVLVSWRPLSARKKYPTRHNRPLVKGD